MITPRRIRNSQLRMLRACGWAYKRTYIDGDAGIASPGLQRGRDVHAAILLAAHEVLAGNALNVYEIAYRAIRGGELEYSEAVAVLTRFQEALGVEFEINPKTVLFIEELLELEIPTEDGPVIFFGTPDLVDRVTPTFCRITDWKSHWQPENETQFKADPQLKRYALLVHARFPQFTHFELVKRFIRYENNKQSEIITADDLVQVRLDLEAEIRVERERLAANDFEATGGTWCALCSHTSTCPAIAEAMNAGVDLPVIEDDIRASWLAGQIVALDAAAASRKAVLKRYLSAEHPTGYVPAPGGGSFGFGPTNGRAIAVDELERTFDEHGLELPTRALKVDLEQLDKVKRRLPQDLVAAIDDITMHTQSSRFEYRTAADPRAKKPTGKVKQEAIL